jgi:hypothetical protein
MYPACGEIIASVRPFESLGGTWLKYCSTSFLSSEAVPGYHVPATCGSWIRGDGPSPALRLQGYRKGMRTRTTKKGKNRRKLVNLPDMVFSLGYGFGRGVKKDGSNFKNDYRKSREHASISKEADINKDE